MLLEPRDLATLHERNHPPSEAGKAPPLEDQWDWHEARPQAPPAALRETPVAFSMQARQPRRARYLLAVGVVAVATLGYLLGRGWLEPSSPAPSKETTPTTRGTSESAGASAPPAGSLAAATSGAKEAPLPANPEEEIRRQVRAWAEAWSQQRVDEYLACYAVSFQPAGGMSREAWERQRRERVLAPAQISVRILDLEVSVAGPKRAQARFRQLFETESISRRATKILELERQAEGWRIIRERLAG